MFTILDATTLCTIFGFRDLLGCYRTHVAILFLDNSSVCPGRWCKAVSTSCHHRFSCLLSRTNQCPCCLPGILILVSASGLWTILPCSGQDTLFRKENDSGECFCSIVSGPSIDRVMTLTWDVRLFADHHRGHVPQFCFLGGYHGEVLINKVAGPQAHSNSSVLLPTMEIVQWNRTKVSIKIPSHDSRSGESFNQ